MRPPAGTFQKIAKLSRDWRVRVLVPVILINVAVFGGLYWLMVRYALDNLTNTHKFGATLLLDQVEIDLRDLQVVHNRALLSDRLAEYASTGDVMSINVYSADGRPIVWTRGEPRAHELAQVRAVMLQPNHPPMWVTDGRKPNLFGVRSVRNAPSCMQCHGAQPVLGAIQIGIDMTRPVHDAHVRVNRNFLLAGGAWIGLLGLMFWTGGIVIGRPLAAMQKSIRATGLEGAETVRKHDLEALADRVHHSLWSLIRAQRQRDEDTARHMARAEQLASLGQLAAGLTHEIKNPLAGVAAALEILRDEAGQSGGAGDLGAGSRTIYDQMLAELRRVSGTVDALLRLGKPQPPHRTGVELTRVGREVASLFAARLRRQGVQLELDLADHVPTLQLDSGLMVQLLMNLLTNAMQATERGGSVKLLVAPFPRHDGVVLAVSDTGRGIAPDHLERIFDPFFTTKEEGTGLGLPICKQIVDQHGGTIRIESEPGKGTRVMVLLPDPRAAQEMETDGALAAG
ncbi:MAG TPA: ATP-binding protein [Thermoanaerobaculia bacterium]|nr:ATP-binding protein [Thermoanaerobaculia bacterium]